MNHENKLRLLKIFIGMNVLVVVPPVLMLVSYALGFVMPMLDMCILDLLLGLPIFVAVYFYTLLTSLTSFFCLLVGPVSYKYFSLKKTENSFLVAMIALLIGIVFPIVYFLKAGPFFRWA